MYSSTTIGGSCHIIIQAVVPDNKKSVHPFHIGTFRSWSNFPDHIEYKTSIDFIERTEKASQ